MNFMFLQTHNEDGFVLIIALIMLLLTSLLGIYATNTTSIELNIAGNEKMALQKFFQAEAAMNVTYAALLNNNSTTGFNGLPVGDEFLRNQYRTPDGWNDINPICTNPYIAKGVVIRQADIDDKFWIFGYAGTGSKAKIVEIGYFRHNSSN